MALKKESGDWCLYSPLGDYGRSFKLDLIDVGMSMLWLLVACTPSLAVIAFATWR